MRHRCRPSVRPSVRRSVESELNKEKEEKEKKKKEKKGGGESCIAEKLESGLIELEIGLCFSGQLLLDGPFFSPITSSSPVGRISSQGAGAICVHRSCRERGL